MKSISNLVAVGLIPKTDTGAEGKDQGAAARETGEPKMIARAGIEIERGKEVETGQGARIEARAQGERAQERTKEEGQGLEVMTGKADTDLQERDLIPTRGTDREETGAEIGEEQRMIREGRLPNRQVAHHLRLRKTAQSREGERRSNSSARTRLMSKLFLEIYLY